MPHVSGHERIRRIRKIEKTANQCPVPALPLTAYADEKNRSLARESGFTEFVTKPVDLDTLASALETMKSRD